MANLTDLMTQLAPQFHGLQPTDLLAVGTLALLEGILSVDNALVLAILVRGLPKNQQKKALLYGMVGAFSFRIIALLLAAYLMHLTIFKIVGGAYLLYLSMKHLFFGTAEDANPGNRKAAKSFWKTIVLVELTDIVFSIDSITAAVAMSKKLVVVWLGGIVGILCLRLSAGALIKLLDRLPKLEDLAYQIVFFIGIRLSLEAFDIHIDQTAFWIMMGVITVLGSSLVYRDYAQRKSKGQYPQRLVQQFEKGEIKLEDLLELENIPHAVLKYLRRHGYLIVKESKS